MAGCAHRHQVPCKIVGWILVEVMHSHIASRSRLHIAHRLRRIAHRALVLIPLQHDRPHKPEPFRVGGPIPESGIALSGHAPRMDRIGAAARAKLTPLGLRPKPRPALGARLFLRCSASQMPRGKAWPAKHPARLSAAALRFRQRIAARLTGAIPLHGVMRLRACSSAIDVHMPSADRLHYLASRSGEWLLA